MAARKWRFSRRKASRSISLRTACPPLTACRRGDSSKSTPPLALARDLRSHRSARFRSLVPYSITSSARASSDGHGEAKRLGGGQVDDQIELGRLLDRDV